MFIFPYIYLQLLHQGNAEKETRLQLNSDLSNWVGSRIFLTTFTNAFILHVSYTHMLPSHISPQGQSHAQLFLMVYNTKQPSKAYKQT